jgi:hypothetical protein
MRVRAGARERLNRTEAGIRHGGHEQGRKPLLFCLCVTRNVEQLPDSS